MSTMIDFDPDAAAQPGTGVFGLPHSRDESRIVLIPVPFDATTSYGGGASKGPAAIRAASAQVDLHDPQFGEIYRHGIFMEKEHAKIRRASREARKAAKPVIEAGGAGPGAKGRMGRALREVDRAGEAVNAFTRERVNRVLKEGKIPGLVGGDHATPFGAIQACAEFTAATGERLGILHIDAHMDFREAFEGFAWSHASIMHNVLTRIPEIGSMVQVGLRDVGKREIEFAQARSGQVFPHFDLDWTREMLDGRPFGDLCARAIEPLPGFVYVSFDIDGLDPSLCPHTGTPVPGGLSFAQACLLLGALKASGRRVVGFDLVEVTPGPKAGTSEPEWDANVGARVLYKLCGACV
ncbi:MAG: agmatinase family protein [Phycisphaeraceae bacterium]|nr:agmatinase family protein [Phycisphaeraceae bacterium]